MTSVVVMLEHVLVQRPVLVVPDGHHVGDGDGAGAGPRGGAAPARHLNNVTYEPNAVGHGVSIN